jgi:hypothetical protein
MRFQEIWDPVSGWQSLVRPRGMDWQFMGEQGSCRKELEPLNPRSRHSSKLEQTPSGGMTCRVYWHITMTTSRCLPCRRRRSRAAWLCRTLVSARDPQRKGNCMTTDDTYLAVFLGSKASPRMKAGIGLLHDLSGRVRGDHAGSADTKRLIGVNVRFVNS